MFSLDRLTTVIKRVILREYFWIIYLISFGEKCLTGRADGNGKARYLTTTFVLSGEVSWWGWKTLKK